MRLWPGNRNPRWFTVAAAIVCTVTAAAPLRSQALLPVGLQDLQFGNVLPGFPTSISRLDAINTGQYRIDGANKAEVRVDLALPTDLVSGGSNLTVQFGSADGGYSKKSNINSSTAFDPSLPLVTKLSNQGQLYVWLGGTVIPTAVQPAGAYSATIVLTVAYTGN